MIFDWLLDDPLFDLFLGEVPEEVKKARENLKKAREEYYEARRRAWKEQLGKGKSENALALPEIPFDGSEREFQDAVERLARACPDARVEGKSVEFPNGWYRSVRIEKKG